MKHLELVLLVLMQHDLKVNQNKCIFGQASFEYHRHIITSKGVATDPKKLEATWLWPIPKDIKGLRVFLGLGLIGYYWRFVKEYGKLAQPLTSLLKKDVFHWDKEA